MVIIRYLINLPATLKRRSKNRILSIKDQVGSHLNNHEDIKEHLVSFSEDMWSMSRIST